MEHSAVFSNLDTEQRKLSSLYQENCKNASPRDAMIVTFTSQSHIHKEKSREQERKGGGLVGFGHILHNLSAFLRPSSILPFLPLVMCVSHFIFLLTLNLSPFFIYKGTRTISFTPHNIKPQFYQLKKMTPEEGKIVQ